MELRIIVDGERVTLGETDQKLIWKIICRNQKQQMLHD